MYILTKVILAIIIGFITSVVIGLFIVPILKKMKIRQNISTFMQFSHKNKNGTPTMGGLIFILSTLVTTIALLITKKIEFTHVLKLVMFVFFSYAFIGFLDDFLSIKKGKNEGLTVIQKLLLQVLVAMIFFYLYISEGGSTALYISTLNIYIEMKWFYGVFMLFVLVGASNAVNLTDGLDGLAGGLSAIAFFAFSLISLTVGYTDMGIFTLILTGSLIGFLVFNANPAKVFMGDTGSLSLGAVMAAVAIITHRELTLLIVAFVFVIETLSDILQIFWYKTFKKRIFLMAPLHHHFEKLGWNEVDIVRMFWVFGFILAAAGIVFGVWI